MRYPLPEQAIRLPLVHGLWIITLAIGLGGCFGGGLGEIDRELSHLVRNHQRDHLNLDDSAADPTATPRTTTHLQPGSTAYRKKPQTRNPAVGDIDVDRRPPSPPDADPVAPTMIEEAEDPVRMSLPEVLNYAIENSREYRNEKEALFITAINLLIERHLWGPRFFNTFTSEIRGTPESGDFDQVVELQNELGVTQRLPYGGSVSASAVVSFTSYLRRVAADPRNEQDTELQLSATVPLLRGAGVVAREDRIQAERDLIYAAREFERFRRGFLVDVSTAYFDLLRQVEQIQNQRMQLRNLQQLAKRFEALAEAGRQPYFEFERSQQQVLFARNDLVGREEAYAQALDSFKIRIGLDVSEGLVIQPIELVVAQPAVRPPQAVEAALQYRLDLQTTQDRVEDARRDVRVARNELLPDLDVTGSVSIGTDDDKDIGGIDFDAGSGSYSLGAVFDAPLDRRIERLRLRRSVIDLERAHRSYTLARDQITLAVRRSIRSMESARFALELQERNVELAERRRINVKLRERTLGPRDVIEAEEDLLEARNRRDDARQRLRENILRFLLDSGQLRVAADGQWLPPAALIPAEAPAEAADDDDAPPDNAPEDAEANTPDADEDAN